MPDIRSVLLHTPSWVFAVFALLLWLGARQLRGRNAPLARAILVPIGFAGWALYNAVSGLHLAPLALAAWAVAAVCCGAVVLRVTLPAGTRYEPATRRFVQPGSAAPLALMMGIFFLRYGVAVATALHPAIAHDAVFMTSLGAVNGAFSGIFAARALRLMRLMRAARLPDVAPLHAAI